MPTSKNKKQAGVTLTELLLVIVIASIVATIAFSTFGDSQKRARDTQRKRDLDQIKKALELAKQDCNANAYYPAENIYNTLTQGLVSLNYMAVVPKDPKTSGQYAYSLNSTTTASVCPDYLGTRGASGSTDFSLKAILEKTNDPDATTSQSKCLGKPGVTTNAGEYYVCNE